MRQFTSRRKCSRCGESFATVAEYEAHLEICDANKIGKKAEIVSKRLRKASEEFE